MADANHAMGHVVHKATYNSETGNYDHPASLSDHLRDDVAAVADKVGKYANGAERVVKNLTGEGEREDLFNK